MSNIDSKQFKEAQRKSWDSVAIGWQKWWKTFEKDAQNLSNHLVELAKINSSSKVLDIATGIGEPAITAARKVGNGNGHVLATDISPQMLSIARQRAASLGLQDVIEFKEGDAETISLPDSAFDAVLCRWGLMFLPDLGEGLSNIYSSLVNGGYLAAAVWASPDKVPFLSVSMKTVVKETGKPMPPSGTPGPFKLADQSIITDALSKCGFKDIAVERINVIFTFSSPEEYTQFNQSIAAPINAMLADQSQERKEEIWKAVTESASNYVDATGNVKLDNESICICAKK
ncbi:MAG TPA: class I SAM-dependent methyltransferase [Nitrososphaeraceae archaeon]|jgi:ubiquinone/menaquinone biosynthesis C-methylase UbiE